MGVMHSTGSRPEKHLQQEVAASVCWTDLALVQDGHAVVSDSRQQLPRDKRGRGSTISQRTNEELAPSYAAGKVPVPQGRECQRETARLWPRCRR